MTDFEGVIIEESLTDKDLLRGLKILGTRIQPVTERSGTPWLKQWTLHTVRIPEKQIGAIATLLSGALLDIPSAWYADFKNEAVHYIIFPNKIFRINRTSKAEYDNASDYGVSLGIPAYQVDFQPFLKA